MRYLKHIFTTTMGLSLCLQAHSHKTIITIQTSSTEESTPIVLKLNELHELQFPVKSASVTSSYKTGPDVKYQLDDLDGDGNADELTFLTIPSINQYIVTLSNERTSHVDEPHPKVFAFMGLNDKKGKHPAITQIETPGNSSVFSDIFPHGVAWESEETAYRLYFDERQNIDIYGKKNKRLELQDTYFYTSDQQLSVGYGYDILWAGPSIACGSLKLWDQEHMSNWKCVEKRGQRIIAQGPVRTIVEMTDKATLWNDGYYNTITTRYTQYTNERDVRVDISAQEPLAQSRLCTGVQRIAGTKERMLNHNGIAASWGTDYPEQSNEKAKARFNPTTVGMAVYVPAQYIAEIYEDSLNCLFVLGRKKESHLHYYITFCTAMETWSGLNSSKKWFEFVKQWKKKREKETNTFEIKNIEST